MNSPAFSAARKPSLALLLSLLIVQSVVVCFVAVTPAAAAIEAAANVDQQQQARANQIIRNYLAKFQDEQPAAMLDQQRSPYEYGYVLVPSLEFSKRESLGPRPLRFGRRR